MQNPVVPLILTLSPYIVGSALVPIYIILVVLLLKTRGHGLLKGVAFVAGLTAIRLLQGVIFGFVLNDAAESTEPGDEGLVVSTMLMVFGIVLLISAYKKWRKQPDETGAPPRWLTKVDNLNVATALGLGLGLPLISVKLWVFTLGALGTIAEAQPGQPAGTIAYLIFILLAQSLLFLPILIRIVMPARSQAILDGISGWLTRHNRTVVVAVSVVFGLVFLYKGLNGLLA